MDELKKALDELYESETKVVPGEFGYLFFQDSDISSKAESLCCEYLITSNGMPNYENMRKLDGYNIFAGEKDSFGWLTGCVAKKETIEYLYLVKKRRSREQRLFLFTR